MRRVYLHGLGTIKDQATRDSLAEIEKASAEYDIVDIAAAFTITGSYTDTRTLNVGTSTLAQTQAFIATLVSDLKKGGANRTN